MIFHDILDDQRFACLTMLPDVRRKVGGDDQESDDAKKTPALMRLNFGASMEFSATERW